MKIFKILLLILFVNLFSINAIDRQIKKLIKNISIKYKKKNPSLVLKKTLAVLDLKESSKDLSSKSVGKTIKSLLENQISDSLIFTLVDRENLKKLMKELELNATGIINSKNSLKLGNMVGAELFLTGEIFEIKNSIRISLKLINVETSEIIASEQIDINKNLLIKEADLYVKSLFQSKYGIKFSLYTKNLISSKEYLTGDNHNPKIGHPIILTTGIDVSYQINKFLKIGAGYFNLFSGGELFLDKPQISVTAESNIYNEVTRYFSFKTSGIKLFINSFISPLPVLNLGIKIAYLNSIEMSLTQDFPGFPVYNIKNITNNQIETKRIIVEGFSHEYIPIINISFTADYLISRRLSIGITAGYLYAPDFIPTSFKTGNKIQDDSVYKDTYNEDIDRNGTFSEYQNFNFSRKITGERIKFNFSSISTSIALSLSF